MGSVFTEEEAMEGRGGGDAIAFSGGFSTCGGAATSKRVSQEALSDDDEKTRFFLRRATKDLRGGRGKAKIPPPG